MKRQGSFYGEQVYTKKTKSTAQPKLSRQNATLSIGGPELKYKDTAFVADATTTGTIVDLSTFASGDTAITRDGNKIAVRSFELRIAMEKESLVPNVLMRFLLVRDKQPNVAAIPSIGYILDTITVESLRNISFLSRFDVLMDKVVVLNQTSSTASGYQKAFLKKYVKVKFDSITTFSDGTASIPTSNSYSLIYFSDVASGTTDVNILGQCRMRFVG
uniref:hypothetical protein n=1 Tax=Shewanella sp. TaxID=50422 RepID=UPI0040482E38